MTLALAGPGALLEPLRQEAGGHRWQRVPPTERNGRVHTSTVTVAVMDTAAPINALYLKRHEDDFRIEWFAGQGKGGQNRNKVRACCRLIHIPTGIKQEAQYRTRETSYRYAHESMLRLLDERMREEQSAHSSGVRREQVGSGQRGDKVRTYALQRDVVHDHRSDAKVALRRVLAGELELLR